MTIQVEFWALLTFLVGLLLSFFGAVWAAGKVLGGRWQKGLDERFEAQDKARLEGSALLRETLDKHQAETSETRAVLNAQLLELEREFMNWRNDLPHRHGERLSRLEATIKSMPSNEDLGKVYDTLNKLAGTVNQLVGENRGQSDTLRLILNQITQKGMK